MFKNKKIQFTFILLIFISYSSLSQNVLNNSININNIHLSKTPIDVSKIKPDFILSVTGGYLIPLGDLAGDLSTVSLTNPATSAKAYFEKYGFTVGGQGKLTIDKKSRYRVRISFQFNQFTNSANDSSGNTTISPKLNFFQFGLGAEWAITNISDITPYIGFEANANIFGGTIAYSNNTTGANNENEYNTVTRYGFTADLGIEKAFNKSFGGFLGVKYCNANLLGKSSDLTGARELNDDAYTVNGFSIDAKNISFVGVYLGLSIYIRD
jgi:hypothetical protein